MWTLAVVFLVAISSFAARADESGADLRQMIDAQFHQFDPNYSEDATKRQKELHRLSDKLAAAEAAGLHLHCSQQLFLEAKWLLNYTAFWDRLDEKLARLELSLDDHD